MNDASTLKTAIKGAYAVFAVTNYWESMSANVEMKQGKAMADAAKEAGVQHFVWSSLMDVTKRKNNSYTIPHSDHADMSQSLRGLYQK